MSARKGGGWVLLLAPSAELWTSCLRHRTQILYLADISMAVAFMELRPGCAQHGAACAGCLGSIAKHPQHTAWAVFPSLKLRRRGGSPEVLLVISGRAPPISFQGLQP